MRRSPLPSSAQRPTPKPFQVPILESLHDERAARAFQEPCRRPDRHRQDLDLSIRLRLLRRAGYERLLFIAHRDEILQQSQDVFRPSSATPLSATRYVGRERPAAWTHVFASIQSLHRIVDSLEPDHFDVVIVDEFHHAEADTYRKLLEHLTPKVLLGLTATPERADGKDILHWFDDRIAYEMRLWEALDRGLLCPFHYFGIGDGTDLRGGRASSAGDTSRATSRRPHR